PQSAHFSDHHHPRSLPLASKSDCRHQSQPSSLTILHQRAVPSSPSTLTAASPLVKPRRTATVDRRFCRLETRSHRVRSSFTLEQPREAISDRERKPIQSKRTSSVHVHGEQIPADACDSPQQSNFSPITTVSSVDFASGTFPTGSSSSIRNPSALVRRETQGRARSRLQPVPPLKRSSSRNTLALFNASEVSSPPSAFIWHPE
ncbi:RHO guanyl-nucleotide exchange factor 3, partial [Striga asiatica]